MNHHLISCIVLAGCFVLASAYGLGQQGNVATSSAQPIYQSGVVTSDTPGHQVNIEVEISGERDLYLVTHHGGDGFSFDWCDWIRPTLVGETNTKKLIDFKWSYADSGWGSVQVGKNCEGGPLRSAGKSYEDGIGTHANSVIHYRLPKNHMFKTFRAIAALDERGVRQKNSQTSVRFLVFTSRPPEKYWSRRQTTFDIDHRAEGAIRQFDIHPEVDVSLFAAEPMLVNPTNIDVDHQGRVWVCEVVNYRGRRNTRPKGDRILVLEDTDADGRADKQTVFYQGSDIDSVHGVCVLGDRVIISAGSQVFFLIDTDGDLRADRKEILFTGIDGTQHDHGIHAFVFGPDGKFYFNFGNAGRQIQDKYGKPITDVAGQIVSIRSDPYREGMVFRCNPDGSEFETLAWNFRNNWEVCVDSFGRMWQSDNDDDGNRGVRINYVMPFGNYGYLDQMTGAGWHTPRIGMASDIPSRHWHQNDPGVIPNLLQTGAGSPTGICVYEGNSLPSVFHNQMIHTDAGPNVVRAYPVTTKGAGFEAKIVNIMDGSKHNQWFRPSDVCVAPDGSLIVADWYDPGVGGHGMGDIERGRLFRVTGKGRSGKYAVPEHDFSTAEGAAAALTSPNQATRFLAWQVLMNFGAKALAPLQKLAQHENPRQRIRAVWAMSKIDPNADLTQQEFQRALADNDPAIRAALVRIIRQIPDRELFEIWFNRIKVEDPSAAVRRELLVSLSHRQRHPVTAKTRIALWTALARSYVTGDRWYLEALGIAAEGHWDECLDELLSGDRLDQRAWHDIVWRSRSSKTPELLAEIISEPEVSVEATKRFLRAFDFVPGREQKRALAKLANQFEPSDGPKSQLVFSQTICRLPVEDLTDRLAAKLNGYLDRCEPAEFVGLVAIFDLRDRNDQLLGLAIRHHETQLGVDAIALVLPRNAQQVEGRLQTEDEFEFDSLINVLHRSGRRSARELLYEYMLSPQYDLERRKKCVIALGRSRQGAKKIAVWVEQPEYDKRLEPAVSAALHSARWGEINEVADRLFPLPLSKDQKKLPRVAELLKLAGNASNGKLVYDKAGTCAKCHIARGAGSEVGPELTEIGSKLSRQGMFESILFPSSGISHNYESWSVLTLDGNLYTGVIVSETDKLLVLKDAEGVERRIEVADIEDKQQQKLSLMPDDLHKELTAQDLADLVEYLMQLKKAQK